MDRSCRAKLGTQGRKHGYLKIFGLPLFHHQRTISNLHRSKTVEEMSANERGRGLRRFATATRRVAGLGALSALVTVACFAGTEIESRKVPSGHPYDALRNGEVGRTREPKPRSFTLVAGGDVLVHSPVASAALSYGDGRYDFRPMFNAIRPLLSRADLAVCHLETPISSGDSGFSYYPVFEVPRQIVHALEYAGYDYCSTASNHAIDAGTSGIATTLKVLDEAGIEHHGTARRARERRRATMVRIGEVPVALLSYTYGLNGFSLPADRPWAVNLIDRTRIISDARKARQAGAEFVIVSLHWGTEYATEPTIDQQRLARKIVGSRAVDLILGHHAHVVQPVARIKGRFIVYGMGNHLSNQSSDCCPLATQDGVLVRVRVREIAGRLRAVRVLYSPTWVDRNSYRIFPVKGFLRDPRTPDALRGTLRASLLRTAATIESLGTEGVRLDR